jgi:tRNA threonylcarbamoyladenosine biosynthesis protein TsaB
MKLLAWDTSQKSGALAALEWDPAGRSGWAGVRLVAEWTLNVDATHSERLLWAIHRLLESARWKIEDVDIFGVGVGPGSFTGLRIGVTTARTMAHALGKPLVGVSSLAALARPVALWLASSGSAGGKASGKRTESPLIVATTDACKGELFALWGSARSMRDCVAMADGDRHGLWKRGVEEEVVEPDALVRKIKRKLGAASWIALGEGRGRYADAWAKLPRARELEVPVPHADQVQGRWVGMLAWEAVQAGLAGEALGVHPRYLRASDAELKLRAGLLPPGPTRGES